MGFSNGSKGSRLFWAIMAIVSSLLVLTGVVLFLRHSDSRGRRRSSMVEVGLNQTTYSTAFSLAENPVSEGGRWMNGGTVGFDWYNVATVSGVAYGMEPSPNNFADATAVLTGEWEPDQEASAVVHSVHQRDAFYEEVELRLRSTVSPHRCTGYEVGFKCSTTRALTCS